MEAVVLEGDDVGMSGLPKIPPGMAVIPRIYANLEATM